MAQAQAVNCLTEAFFVGDYSSLKAQGRRPDPHRYMANEISNSDSRTQKLRNIDAKRRWELFHQAIAHAKRSNVSALQDEEPRVEPRRPRPLLSIAR